MLVVPLGAGLETSALPLDETPTSKFQIVLCRFCTPPVATDGVETSILLLNYAPMHYNIIFYSTWPSP